MYYSSPPPLAKSQEKLIEDRAAPRHRPAARRRLEFASDAELPFEEQHELLELPQALELPHGLGPH